MDLEGARCLVTGCSSGIGRATALALSHAGARVWASARKRESIAALETQGMQLVELDLTDAGGVSRAVSLVGRLDVLVNNAGYGLEGAIEEVGDEELFEQYNTNVFGPWRLCRAVLPGMRASGRGAIVNISSFGGEAPYPGIGAYRSSKFALEGFSWTLRLEVAHFGIRVLDVQPGLTESEFGKHMKRAKAMAPDNAYAPMHESAARAYLRMSPHALPPEAVADAIVAELRKDTGPLRLRVGEDAHRMVAAVRAGDEAYERYLVSELGFDWHRLEAVSSR
ncbi:MAG: SDR family oxidoreductase [Acidobacteria bacterium]|nr:SDR family oxidoreductase [Acidobacteriota bacterium]MCI0719443.1 SDR family oxidoreductase [Acidobacteriota bacterium]